MLTEVKNVKGACAPIQAKIHPKIWSLFEERLVAYELATSGIFKLELRFAELDLLANGAAATAVEFVSKLQKQFPEEHRLNHSKLLSGSIVVELLTAASSVPWWLAMFIVVGIGSKVNVNFDVNRMFDQIGNVIKHLSNRVDADERQNLSDKVEELGITVVISDQSLMTIRPVAQVINSNVLTFLTKQVAQNSLDADVR